MSDKNKILKFLDIEGKSYPQTVDNLYTPLVNKCYRRKLSTVFTTYPQFLKVINILSTDLSTAKSISKTAKTVLILLIHSPYYYYCYLYKGLYY